MPRSGSPNPFLFSLCFQRHPKLANWVSTQRQEYRFFLQGTKTRLSREKIQALDAIGFVWDAHRNGVRKRKHRNTEIRSTGPWVNNAAQQQLGDTFDAGSRMQNPAASSFASGLPSTNQPSMNSLEIMAQKLGLPNPVMRSQPNPARVHGTMPSSRLDEMYRAYNNEQVRVADNRRAASHEVHQHSQLAAVMQILAAREQPETLAPGANTAALGPRPRGVALPQARVADNRSAASNGVHQHSHLATIMQILAAREQPAASAPSTHVAALGQRPRGGALPPRAAAAVLAFATRHGMISPDEAVSLSLAMDVSAIRPQQAGGLPHGGANRVPYVPEDWHSWDGNPHSTPSAASSHGNINQQQQALASAFVHEVLRENAGADAATKSALRKLQTMVEGSSVSLPLALSSAQALAQVFVGQQSSAPQMRQFASAQPVSRQPVSRPATQAMPPQPSRTPNHEVDMGRRMDQNSMAALFRRSPERAASAPALADTKPPPRLDYKDDDDEGIFSDADEDESAAAFLEAARSGKLRKYK